MTDIWDDMQAQSQPTFTSPSPAQPTSALPIAPPLPSPTAGMGHPIVPVANPAVNPPPPLPPQQQPATSAAPPPMPAGVGMAPVSHAAPNENQAGTALIDIADENESESIISRYFYKNSSGKAFLYGFILFTVIPASLCILGAYLGGVLTMDSGVGFFKDYAGASYFTLGILLPVLVRRMMTTIPTTVESLSTVIELKGDGGDSELTKEYLDDLINTYSYLYCKETGRSMDGVTMPTDPLLKQFVERMFLTKKIIIFLCSSYVLATAFNRFKGVGDVMLWHFYDASAIAFIGRTLSEIMLGAIMGPLVLYPIILCVMITYHSLKEISSKNSLKYIRFSKDEAGGLGDYGIQSFMNTIALLPYSFILVGVIYQAKDLGTSLSASTAAATVVYLALLLFVFFFPLSSAAVSMSKLKKIELTLVSEHYANYYDKFKLSLASADDLSAILENSEAMIAAEQVFDGIMNQPSVPYSKFLIGKLAGVIAPVFGLIGSLFIF
jgi:hypothetical protein